MSAEGRLAISVHNDVTLRLWGLPGGACLQTVEDHSDRVNAVAISADGRRALLCSNDKTLRLWDLTTDRCFVTFTGDAELNAADMAPDATTLVAGDASGKMHFLRLENLE